MMIFDPFTATNGRRVFFPTNKTFEFVQLLRGNFFCLYLKPFCKKITIRFSFQLIYENVCLRNEVRQDLICICRQSTLSPVSSINSSQTDKSLPVKTSKQNFVTFLRVLETAFLIIREKSLRLLRQQTREAILLVHELTRF